MGSVAVIGLGRAGTFAVEAMRSVAGDMTCVGVDPRSDAAEAAPLLGAAVHRDLAGLQHDGNIRLAIVATPTGRHVETISTLLAQRPPGLAAVWSEKPLATRPAELAECLAVVRAQGIELRTLLHTAFAPEVLWGAERLPELTESHGPAVATESTFLDPYEDDLERASSVLGSPWLDSGINALSVLERFIDIERVVEVTNRAPLHCEARFSFSREQGLATIRTTWTVASREKTTTIRFRDGARLDLAHHDASARIISPSGETVEARQFGSDRLAVRYATMFASYLGRDDKTLTPDVERRLDLLSATVAELEGT